MHRLHESPLWKYVALYVAATLMVPYAVMGFPVVAEAQAQPVVESASVIVLPIEDTEGSTESVISEQATDALALALEDSREFIVTSKRDLVRELAQLELEPPLSVAEQMRLGERLQVDKVITGQVRHLRVTEKTGQVSVNLSVAVLDLATGEFLNGANVSTVTKALPGWTGESARVINDALREIAEDAVAEIRTSRIPEGFVTSVNQFGVATVDLGQDDRLKSGMAMILFRPVYQRDLGEIILQKVGRYSVSEVGARTSKMMPLGEGRAGVGDRAYQLYQGPERVEAQRRKESSQQTITVVAAIAALFGVMQTATGSSTTDAPAGVTSRLFQQAPGDEAVIRVHVPHKSIPLDDQIYAWLFYRSDGRQNFSLLANKLVDVILEQRLPNNVWDDDSAFDGPFEIEEEFTYITAAGDEEDGSIDLLFYHWPLQAGHTYYHRVQRVVEPPERAGAGAPITTDSVRTMQQDELETPTLEIDPPESQAEGSKPTAGVTYFTPPVLQTPEDGAQNQQTNSITFTWSGTVGANEYVLQVFPEDDPDGRRNPDYEVQMRQDQTGTMFQTIDADFAPNSRFYWRVGARRSGEALPLNERLNQEGWLFSAIRSFTTAAAPPPPPGTSSASYRLGPGGVFSGTFGPRYRHRTPGLRSRGLR
ncbi:MAG: hypothetical protein U9R79_06835 [Armatimonadota bacterium]|nr:hypothetical protein [Armatimonadota bacterium]